MTAQQKLCQMCGVAQPCRIHGRTPVDVADYEELHREVAEALAVGVLAPQAQPEIAIQIVEALKFYLFIDDDSPMGAVTRSDAEKIVRDVIDAGSKK